MNRFRRMMVAVTRSHRDESLIRYAAMAARLAKPDEVCVVHVPGQSTDARPTPREQTIEEIERATQPAFAAVPDAPKLSIHVLRGPLIDALLSFAAEQRIDLILLGHRPGKRPGRKALIRRLTMKAPCSVWVVPDGSAAQISRVLAPVDFSKSSADALEVAADITARAGAEECVAAHIYHTDAIITYEEAAPIVRGEEQAAYEEFVAPLNLHGTSVRPVFEESEEVAEAIHEIAQRERADLKVISTRGRSRSAAILLGSVAEGVIVEARTPLLVVKHFGSRLNLLESLLDRAFQSESPHFN